MDAVTLDGLVAELEPRLRGRHLARARLAGSDALHLEVSGEKWRLWLDASRATPGIYAVEREAARRLEAAAGPPSGRARQALLHLRKHVDGARVRSLRRVAGERVLVLEAAEAVLLLSLGSASALSLVVAGASLGALGDGPPQSAAPPEAPEKEWSSVSAEALRSAVRAARAAGESPLRAALVLCPGLSPRLARLLDDDAATFERLRERLRAARPTLVAPGPPEAWRDADLAASDAMALWPFDPVDVERGTLLHPESWTEAAGLFLEARRRGQRFEAARRRALEEARRKRRRLAALEAHLSRDLASLPDESALRRDGEALLASPALLPAAAREVDVADPYTPDSLRRVAVDPALSAPQNADRLFARVRRVERARRQVQERLRDARAGLRSALEAEERLQHARDLAELPEGAALPDGSSSARSSPDPSSAPRKASGPRHYLTSKGLSILVGRGARENHHLTFTVARPDDLWLHARDVPGAHVVLKDPEGRAGAEDLREAAEVAAFFSEATAEAQADVHVTRRKHLRPARGGPGRVTLGHTETLRVAPRDPEGRLRRRG